MLTLLTIDPGTSDMGLAQLEVVQPAPKIVWQYHLFRTKRTDPGVDFAAWWYDAIQRYCTERDPTIVCYEDYTWQGPSRTSNQHAALMWQQIGVIRAACIAALQVPPLAVSPAWWRKRLLGPGAGAGQTDSRIAEAITQRGYPHAGSTHVRDATAMGLVLADLYPLALATDTPYYDMLQHELGLTHPLPLERPLKARMRVRASGRQREKKV